MQKLWTVPPADVTADTLSGMAHVTLDGIGPRVSTFGRFHDVARRHLKERDRLLDEIPEEPKDVPRASPDEFTEYDHWRHANGEVFELIDEHSAITIVFAAAACELYINDVGARLLGDTYYHVHIDRMELLSKWIIVPRLINGHQVDRGGQAYSMLKALIGRRNELMHPKSKPFNIEAAIKRFNEGGDDDDVDAPADAVRTLNLLGDESVKFAGPLAGIGLYDHEEHFVRLIKDAGQSR